MKNFNADIIALTRENNYFRKEIVTGDSSQVVVMSIQPGGEIGEETHDLDQILIFVQGQGEAILNDQRSEVKPNHLVHVPAGTKHNFVNTGQTELKLFTVYAPPEHAPGTVHKTKEEADAAEAEHSH